MKYTIILNKLKGLFYSLNAYTIKPNNAFLKGHSLKQSM